jgi:hypothetical protein
VGTETIVRVALTSPGLGKGGGVRYNATYVAELAHEPECETPRT